MAQRDDRPPSLTHRRVGPASPKRSRAQSGTGRPNHFHRRTEGDERKLRLEAVSLVVPMTRETTGPSLPPDVRKSYECTLSTTSAISKKVMVGDTPYNPVTFFRNSSVMKASAAAFVSQT